MRWRVWFDRLIVLVILIAAWQGGSLWLGNYWLSSPWSVATRFVASLSNGELAFHGGYTIKEGLGGGVIGGGQGGRGPAASPPAARLCCSLSCSAASRSWWRSSIPSWLAATARPSSLSRRC